VRLLAGCKFLKETDVPIVTIAQMIGFTNPERFRRTFLRSFKLTPSEYRLAHERRDGFDNGYGLGSSNGGVHRNVHGVGIPRVTPVTSAATYENAGMITENAD
jgi:hypothetical protein